MASSYRDLFNPTLSQFAYLKTPEKIRAAYINAGGRDISLSAVKRRLPNLDPSRRGPTIGDCEPGDSRHFQVRGLVKPVAPKKVTTAITHEERETIARLASGLSEKPAPRRICKSPSNFSNGYADGIIRRVCEALEILPDHFFSDSRQSYIVAARAVVVVLLRERNPDLYSFPRLAGIIGRSCHSTAVHGAKNLAKFCSRYPAVAQIYAELSECAE